MYKEIIRTNYSLRYALISRLRYQFTNLAAAKLHLYQINMS
jgi:hypothetical protein